MKAETRFKWRFSLVALALCLAFPAWGQVKLGNVPTTNANTGFYSLGSVGTGASAPARLVSREVLLHTINVKDYGATGNGTTDDTAALQAALNAWGTNNRTIYIPKGVYKVTSTLNIPLVSATGAMWNPTNIFRIRTDGQWNSILDGRTLSNAFVLKYSAPELERQFSFDIDGLSIYGPAWNGSTTQVAPQSGWASVDGSTWGDGGCLLIASEGYYPSGGNSVIRNSQFGFHRRGLVVSNYVTLTVENCWNVGNRETAYHFWHVDQLAVRDSWFGDSTASSRPNFYGFRVGNMDIPGTIENCEGFGNFLWSDGGEVSIKCIDIEGMATNGIGVIVLSNACRTVLDTVKFNWRPWGTNANPPVAANEGINIRCINGGNAALTLINCYGNHGPTVQNPVAPNTAGIWFHITNATSAYKGVQPIVLFDWAPSSPGTGNLATWTNAYIDGVWTNVPQFGVALTNTVTNTVNYTNTLAPDTDPRAYATHKAVDLIGMGKDSDVTRGDVWSGAPYYGPYLQFPTNAIADAYFSAPAEIGYTNIWVSCWWIPVGGTAYPYTNPVSIYNYYVKSDGTGTGYGDAEAFYVTTNVVYPNSTSVVNVVVNYTNDVPARTSSPHFYMIRTPIQGVTNGPQYNRLLGVTWKGGPY
jgi:hypothetical protein